MQCDICKILRGLQVGRILFFVLPCMFGYLLKGAKAAF